MPFLAKSSNYDRRHPELAKDPANARWILRGLKATHDDAGNGVLIRTDFLANRNPTKLSASVDSSPEAPRI